MGVCGSGKSTIAEGLAQSLGWPCLDADHFHTQANIEKMAAGTPLANADRLDWIRAIAAAVNIHADRAVILACSALNREVRAWLIEETARDIIWCWLQISEATAQARVGQRAEHFMPSSLVRSQFATLDPPAEAWQIDASRSVAATLSDIQSRLRQQTAG